MRGFTLMELLVALALLGIILGVSTMSLMSVKSTREMDERQRARADAIRSGAPRAAHGVLFLPDGRAIGPGVDPLTGAARAQ